MHRLSLCLLVSLLSACIVHAAPPTVGQYEIRKRTSTGFESYGVTLTNGQAIGQSGGIPAAVTVGTGTVTSVALTLPGIFSVTGSPITESGTLAASLATQTANRVWAGPTTGSAAAPTFRALVANDLPDLSSVYQPIAGILTAFSGLSNTTGVLTNNGSGSLSYTATSTGGNKDADSGKLVKFDSVGGVYFSNEVRIYPYPSGSNFLQFNNSRIQWLRGVSDYCAIIPSEAGSACTFYFPTNPGPHTLALEDGNITGTAGGLSSTLAVTSGGTGQTSYTDGQLLIGNTTGNTLAKATLTAGSGISITNGHGTITIASTSSGGTVTSVAASVPAFLSVSGSPITSSGTLAITLSGTALPVANGGTGQSSLQASINALLAAGGALSQGDLFYFNGTNIVRLPAGADGQYLKTQGVGANPIWGTVSSGLTIGSTTISGGTSGRLLMSGTAVGELTLGSNVATWLSTPTEANLKAVTGGISWLDTAGTLSANSAVSSPTRLISGSWYSGGTGTTTLPHILIEPTGTTASTTWDTAGTGLGINGSTGTLFDVKTNGVGAGDYTPNTNFKITADGYVWFGAYKMLGTNYGGCNAYGNLYYTSGAGINFLNGSSLVFNNDACFFSAPWGGSSITGVLHLNGANSTEELRISANGSANAGSYLGLKFDGTNGVISSTGIVKITSPIGLPTGTNARAGNATLVAGTVTVSNATVTTSTLVILTRKTAGGTIGGLTYTLSSGSSFTINSDSATDTSTVSFLLIENP